MRQCSLSSGLFPWNTSGTAPWDPQAAAGKSQSGGAGFYTNTRIFPCVNPNPSVPAVNKTQSSADTSTSLREL